MFAKINNNAITPTRESIWSMIKNNNPTKFLFVSPGLIPILRLIKLFGNSNSIYVNPVTAPNQILKNKLLSCIK